jgi:ornithine cyclodeaminase/alanine dehydrogenase-like protein (mu-crystallin family)
MPTTDNFFFKSSGWLAEKTLKVCDEAVDAVDNADLIVTATFASTPIVMSANVKLGAHIMAVGACVPSMAELDPHLLVNSQVNKGSLHLLLFSIYV